MDRYASCVAALIGSIIAIGGVVAGCQTSASAWVGQWRGTYPPPEGRVLSEQIRGTLLSVRLEIRTDGTYALEDSGITSAGEVRFGAKSCDLVAKFILERPAPSNTPIVRLRRIDARTVELVGAGSLFPGPVRLYRKAQPNSSPDRSSNKSAPIPN